MFNHSNLSIHSTLESILRCLIVTPQMHIIHHSNFVKETNSNYGFNFSFWDRIFKTYVSEMKRDSKVGLNYYRDENGHKLLNLLKLPFIDLRNGKEK